MGRWLGHVLVQRPAPRTTALLLTQTMFSAASGALIGDFERGAGEVLA